MTTESVPFYFHVNETDAQSVIAEVKAFAYRHVYAIMYEQQFNLIMETAYANDVAGEDYTYLFPGIDIFNWDLQKFPLVDEDGEHTAMAKIIDGSGFIQMQGGVTSSPIYPTDVIDLGPSLEPGSGFDKFRSSWTEALEDPVFVRYVREKLPSAFKDMDYDPETPFALDPGAIRPFLYDAVTMMGLSMCDAAADADFFTGVDVMTKFEDIYLAGDLEGASGLLTVANDTTTRNQMETRLSSSCPLFPLTNFRSGKKFPTARSALVMVTLLPRRLFHRLSLT
jgi:hypothetical protein